MQVDNAEKVEIPQGVGSCGKNSNEYPKAKGQKTVNQGYNFLSGDGTESGQETFTVVQRYYYYGARDCSANYLGSSDRASEYVLSTLGWPNP
jgi:hypothetical protein